eukprot:403351541
MLQNLNQFRSSQQVGLTTKTKIPLQDFSAQKRKQNDLTKSKPLYQNSSTSKAQTKNLPYTAINPGLGSGGRQQKQQWKIDTQKFSSKTGILSPNVEFEESSFSQLHNRNRMFSMSTNIKDMQNTMSQIKSRAQSNNYGQDLISKVGHSFGKDQLTFSLCQSNKHDEGSSQTHGKLGSDDSVSQQTDSDAFMTNNVRFSQVNDKIGSITPIDRSQCQYTPQPERNIIDGLNKKSQNHFHFKFNQATEGAEDLTPNCKKMFPQSHMKFNRDEEVDEFQQDEDYEIFSIRSISKKYPHYPESNLSLNFMSLGGFASPPSDLKNNPEQRFSMVLQQVEIDETTDFLREIKEDNNEIFTTHGQITDRKFQKIDTLTDQNNQQMLETDEIGSQDDEPQIVQSHKPYSHSFNMTSLIKVIKRNSEYTGSRLQTNETTICKDRQFKNKPPIASQSLQKLRSAHYEQNSTDLTSTPVNIKSKYLKKMNSAESSRVNRLLNRRTQASSSSQNVVQQHIPRTFSPEISTFKKQQTSYYPDLIDHDYQEKESQQNQEKLLQVEQQYTDQIQKIQDIQNENMRLNYFIKSLSRKKVNFKFHYDLLTQKNSSLRTQINYLLNIADKSNNSKIKII